MAVAENSLRKNNLLTSLDELTAIATKITIKEINKTSKIPLGEIEIRFCFISESPIFSTLFIKIF